MICDYCKQDAKLVTGEVIYPHRADLHSKWFYQCKACGAYVGCHGPTKVPLGRLANAELRTAKQDAHAAFDPLWKSGEYTRKAAYAWLAGKLGIPARQAHIGMFDVAQCQAVVRATASIGGACGP